MCKCTPNIRTPFCGKPGCEAPAQVSSKDQLLPCPFCGGEAEYEEVRGGFRDEIRWTVGCKLLATADDEDDSCCGYQSIKTHTRKQEALTYWNRRYPAAEPETQRLRGILRNIGECISGHDDHLANDIAALLAEASDPERVEYSAHEPRTAHKGYECSQTCGYHSATPPDLEKCNTCQRTGTSFGEFCKCGAQDFGHACPQCGADVVYEHPDSPPLRASQPPGVITSASVDSIQEMFFRNFNAKVSRQECRLILEDALRPVLTKDVG